MASALRAVAERGRFASAFPGAPRLAKSVTASLVKEPLREPGTMAKVHVLGAMSVACRPIIRTASMAWPGN